MSADRKQTFGNEAVIPNSEVVRGGYDSGGPSDEEIERTLEMLHHPSVLGELAEKIRVERVGIDDIVIISGEPANAKILDVAKKAFSALPSSV